MRTYLVNVGDFNQAMNLARKQALSQKRHFLIRRNGKEHFVVPRYEIGFGGKETGVFCSGYDSLGSIVACVNYRGERCCV